VDVVLLDMIMPRKSGKETFYDLRAIKPDLRIIISSGFAHDAAVQELIDAGACAFIQKPYRFQELVGVIEKALG